MRMRMRENTILTMPDTDTTQPADTSTPLSTREELEATLQHGFQRAKEYRWNAAIEAFRRAVALDAESTEARFRLGWALWNAAEDIKPTFADMAFVSGAQALGFDGVAKDGRRKFQSYRQLLTDAEAYLNSVLERDSGHARARYYLSKTLQALDKRVEAKVEARKAAELDPSNRNYTQFATSFDQATNVTTTVQPRDVIMVTPTAETWDDLVLDAKTKRELRQMQLMLEKPELARELGIQPPTGILLKGAPGTGKTTIARILAHEAKCNFFAVTPADINQMYVGESEKRVRDIFAKARANAPAIIFVDEIDALLPVRQGGTAFHSDKVVNQFLQEMDGLSSNNRVFMVGATNRADMLDPAVRRGGRLSREIEIPIPDFAAREKLFSLCTRHASLDLDVSLSVLAEKTQGYSGADIKALVNEAGLQALIRITDSRLPLAKSLIMSDFLNALENLG